MDFSIENKDGLTIVRFHVGNVSLFESRSLQSSIEKSTEDERVLALDLSSVEHMDSSALILFLKLSENLNLRGGFLILFGIRDSIKSLMTLTYLDHIVEIVATEADAIEIGTQTKNPREFVTSLNQALIFRGESRYHFIPYSEITHLESDGRATTVHTLKENYRTNKLLKDMETRIVSSIFLRIHKSYVVNMNYVNGMQYSVGGMYSIFLRDQANTSLPVGRMYVQRIKALLGLGTD